MTTPPFIEHGVDKVERQPLVSDPTFVAPSTDPTAAPAQGFLLAVYCDAPPADGDVATYVAANTRFELRAGAAAATYAWLYLTGIDGATGDTVIVTDENGEPILAYTPVA